MRMSELEYRFIMTGIDPVAKATRGKHTWDEPGMEDIGVAGEEFTVGKRVEVRTERGWLLGTVRESYPQNDWGILVECDVTWHDDTQFMDGKGALVEARLMTRRALLCTIREAGGIQQVGEIK